MPNQLTSRRQEIDSVAYDLLTMSNSIILYKSVSKYPPPVELCWQKKEIPRISFIFSGCPTSRQNLTENC
jgi:hypothetical protein